MTLLEISILTVLFVFPIAGGFFIFQLPNQEQVASRGHWLLLFFSALGFVLSGALLFWGDHKDSVYQMIATGVPPGQFTVSLGLGQRTPWLLAHLGFFGLFVTAMWAEGIGSSWPKSKIFYLLAIFSIGAFTLLSTSIFISLVGAEIFLLICYFFQRVEAGIFGAYLDRGIFRRGFYLLLCMVLLGLTAVSGIMNTKSLEALAVAVYVVSLVLNSLSIKSWEHIYTLMTSALFGVFFLARVGIGLSVEKFSLVSIVIYSIVALFQGAMTLTTKKIENLSSHTLLSGIALFLASRSISFGVPADFIRGSELTFLLSVAIAVIAGIQIGFRPSIKRRIAIYFLLGFLVMPFILGLPLIMVGFVLTDTNSDKSIFVPYLVGLIFFSLGLGRLCSALWNRREGENYKWTLRNDYGELILAAMILALFFLQVTGPAWSELDLKTGSLSPLWASLFAMAVFLPFIGCFFWSQRRPTLLFEKQYEAWNGEVRTEPADRLLSMVKRVGVRFQDFKGQLDESFKQRGRTFLIGFCDKDSTILEKTVWLELKAYVASGSALLALIHTGLLRSFWFWGLMVWLLSGVLFGLR